MERKKRWVPAGSLKKNGREKGDVRRERFIEPGPKKKVQGNNSAGIRKLSKRRIVSGEGDTIAEGEKKKSEMEETSTKTEWQTNTKVKG